MNYNLFRTGLVGDFLDKVNQEESSFIKLYDNQEKFLYPFKEIDILESNIKVVNENLGKVLLATFYKFKEDQQVTDFECAKILYENLKLTPAQAGNAAFWNYLHHFDMYEYIHKRWKNQGNMQTHIKRHWLMNLTSQKHLINFPLTTLWWSIHLTIDENREDKYELSKVYFSNNRFRTVSLGGMSFVRHKPAILSVLKFMEEHRAKLTENMTYTELGNEISKFVNLLGGTKPLSFFDINWFTQKLEERFQIKSKLNSSYTELEKLEQSNRLLKQSLLELKQKLELQNINNLEVDKVDYPDIEAIIKRGAFGAKESNYILVKYKNSTNLVKQNILNLIEGFLTRENLLVRKRVKESFKLLKKTFLKQIINSNTGEEGVIPAKPTVFMSNTMKSDLVKTNKEFITKDVTNVLGYFCLYNSGNPNYVLSDVKSEDFDYCIEINEANRNGFLLYFYQEGKIKKTKIDASLLNKTKNHLYSNGKCNHLGLKDVKLVVSDFLIGIAYSKNGITKFKAMDGSDNTIFRDDNNSLHQEGKKILYVQDYEEIKFKILPYSIKEDLGTLLQGPLGNGSNILNNYHSVKWQTLKKYWPELFHNKQSMLGFID